MTGRREEPVPLGDAVRSVARDLGVPDPAVLERVVELWCELVGADVAQHSRVRSVRSGVCSINVDGPEWASQLRYLEQPLLERCAAALGPRVVTRVRIAVRGVEGPDSGPPFW